MTIMMARQMMGVHGLIITIVLIFCAAVRGTIILRIVVLLGVLGLMLTTLAALTVFASF
jgi:hypothetical protein